METDQQAHLTFHLTGRIIGGGLAGIDDGLRPLLFARYQRLAALRYAFPVVLAQGGPERSFMGLSEVFDQALRTLEGDAVSERSILQARTFEREVRALVEDGSHGTLGELLEKAIVRLGVSEPAVVESGKRLVAAMPVDGPVLACDRAMPAKLFSHLWASAHARKARDFRADVDRLVLRLTEILRADFVRSDAGRSPAALRASIGSSFEPMFDFDAMSRTLGRNTPAEGLPPSRRDRIEGLLEVLRGQRFYRCADAGNPPYEFAFKSAAAALEAYHDRLPQAVELARAMAVAELEVKGEYRESWHDRLFEDFGSNGLEPSDLEAFPDYLVTVDAGKMKAAENADLVEILARGLPVKILVQTDDLLGNEGDGHLAFGLHNRHLVSTALSLSDVFVLQASASSLPSMRVRLANGMMRTGPALFSVYSGAGDATAPLPPYLVAAAATESRAFPTFAYDPFEGGDWASRFHLASNPQPEADWPTHQTTYESEAMQRVEESTAFTFLDFAACDRRLVRHLALVARGSWSDVMVAAPEALRRDAKGLPEQAPYVSMVDAEDRLHRVLVDQRLVREAKRCLGMWRSLQELGGIHNSHAQRLLETERKAWDASHVRDPAEPPSTNGQTSVDSAAVAPAPTAPAPEVEEVVEAPRSDDPYIETPRCTSCNECTQINSKMFAYNENKQATIADPDAGTFRQLVEAAESCQVAIIHPGKPRNPDEPGLEELMRRAEVFA